MFRQITIAAMTLTLAAFGTTTSQVFAGGGHSSHAGHSSHVSNRNSSHMASNHRDHRNSSFHHEHHRHFGGHYYGYGWGYPTYAAVEYAPADVVVEPVVETEPVEVAAEVEPVAVATSTVCEPVSYGIDGYAPSWGYGSYRGHYNHVNSGHFNSGHFNSGHHGSFQGHGEHKGGGRRG